MLSVTIIDNPSSLVRDDYGWHPFTEVLRLRLIGYGYEYPPNVLPVDKEDFFSTHILIHQRNSLICSYKFVTARSCHYYNTPFPPIQILEKANLSNYIPTVRKIVDKSNRNKEQIAYCGSWTIHPDARQDKDLTKNIRELVIATHFHYQKIFNIKETLICGVIRFKTHLYQESFGYERLKINDSLMGAINMSQLGGEPVYMLHLKEYTAYGKKCYEDYLPILNASTVLTGEEPSKKQVA